MTVTKNISRAFLITKVIPAIVACWPAEHRDKTIWIQQDNAKTHVPHDDPDFALAVLQSGLDIRLMNQPPNSPDMNVLDLGFFASLQAKTHLRSAKNLDELVANVEQEFRGYEHDNLRRVYLTLQSCLIEVMKQAGGNGYKIPHMYKDGLIASGSLPASISCSPELYQDVIQKLAQL